MPGKSKKVSFNIGKSKSKSRKAKRKSKQLLKSKKDSSQHWTRRYPELSIPFGRRGLSESWMVGDRGPKFPDLLSLGDSESRSVYIID